MPGKPTRAHTRRIERAAALLALAAALVLVAPRSTGSDDVGIRFGDNLIQALQQARREKLVTVAYFSGRHCKWCRKMQVTTFPDRRVRALVRRFVWVKIDVEDQPELAAMFGLQGVPYVVLLNVQGEPLAAKAGYVPPAKMAALLREWVGKAHAGGTDSVPELIERLKRRVSAASQPADVKAALAEAVERLAQPDRAGRKAILETVRTLGPGAWDALCGMMRDRRLSIRAAAGEALAGATGQTLPFDPFADGDTRSRQVAAWKQWIETNRGRPTATRPAASAPATQPASPDHR